MTYFYSSGDSKNREIAKNGRVKSEGRVYFKNIIFLYHFESNNLYSDVY